jgi:hypothetical protein
MLRPPANKLAPEEQDPNNAKPVEELPPGGGENALCTPRPALSRTRTSLV